MIDSCSITYHSCPGPSSLSMLLLPKDKCGGCSDLSLEEDAKGFNITFNSYIHSLFLHFSHYHGGSVPSRSDAEILYRKNFRQHLGYRMCSWSLLVSYENQPVLDYSCTGYHKYTMFDAGECIQDINMAINGQSLISHSTCICVQHIHVWCLSLGKGT